MKNRITILALLSLLAVQNSQAANSMYCTGSHGNFDFTISIDKDTNNDPEGVRIFDEAKRYVVFTKSQVSAGMINVGTEKQPFLNYQIKAGSKLGKLQLRFPEQDPEADFITVYVSGRVNQVQFNSKKGIEFRCQEAK